MSRPIRHPVARGFDRAASAYERGRPEYPPQALRFLARLLALRSGRTLLELGSGTGKLSRGLVRFGAAIVAVEPSSAMRAEFELAVPGVLAISGTAERVPLPDRFADGAVAAQAFHWFRPRPTARELARVVRPGGTVALLWNVRDRRMPLVRRLDAVVDRHTPPRPGRWRNWKRAFPPADRQFGALRLRTFRRVVRTPHERVVQHLLSVSRVALLPGVERRAVAREVRALLRSDPASRGRTSVELPTITEVYWTRRRARNRSARPKRRTGRTRRSGRTSRA